MKVLTQWQVDEIVDKSLGDFLPRATQMTWEEFCEDCPRRWEHCFPCQTARTMIRVYLAALVAVQARLN